MEVPLKLSVEEEAPGFSADERTWECRDEQYLIWSARKKMSNEKNGIDASKSWLLTAKTLFPSDVDIHLETYRIEKSRGEMRDAANTFCILFRDFTYEPKLWIEIKKLTAALRSLENCEDKEFYNKMFNLMPAEHQHRLLLVAAKRSENTMDHCRLMLLLLSKFHSAVLKHGVELMETILNAEKILYENNPVNCYRKLLAVDLTPKLLKSGDLQPKHIFRLFFKALEFYICYLTTGATRIEALPEDESTIQNPWENLFFVYQKATAKLGWELSNIFESGWNKEAAWQKIRSCIRFHPQVLTSDAQCRQVVYGMSLLFLNSLHEFHEKIYEGNLIMVEIPLELYNIKESDTDRNETPSGEPPSKRRKTNEEKVIVTVTNKNVPISTFTYAFRCWDLFHSATSFEREFLKVTQTLRLEVWFKRFLQDVYLYKGSYKKCLMNLSFNESIMKRNIHLIASYFWLKEYQLMLDGIHEVVQQIRQNWSNSSATVNDVDVASADTKNSGSAGTNSSNNTGNVITSAPGDDFNRNENRIPPPVHSRSQRHLHFLSLTNENILKYVVKLLIIALRRSNPPLGIDSCLVDGHVLVLLQLDWPNERHIFSEIIERIQHNQRFTYSLFMKYILNIEMLEEFTYLYSERGGSIPIDIMIPSSNQLINQRRMSTRGVDKGAKEDFKMAMKRQAARWMENINQIIMNFITTEKESISSCLETPPVTK